LMKKKLGIIKLKIGFRRKKLQKLFF